MENEIKVLKDGEYPRARVRFGDKEYPAVVGRGGVVDPRKKIEGDLKTPSGAYEILAAYYRPDRLGEVVSGLPLKEIYPNDVWVEDPSSDLYNQPAKEDDLPEGVDRGRLYREDHLYDVFLDLSYNRKNPISGKGSAIFFHLARDQENSEKTPTTGCIAVKRNDLLEIVSKINSQTTITIIE